MVEYGKAGVDNMVEEGQEYLLEQCSFTGGRLSSLAMSVFFITDASAS